MKTKSLILFLLVLLVFGCTKREVIYNSEASEDYTLASILKLDHRECLYDAPSNTLKYALSSTQLSNFSAYTEFQAYTEVMLNGQKLENNGVNNFGAVAYNTPYELVFQANGESKQMMLVFTKISLVQIITIDPIKNEPKTLAKLLVYPSDSSHQMVETFIGIEIRGRTTVGLPKKSYGFKPLHNQDMSSKTILPFFDMAPNTKWSLDAMYSDPSKSRNKTSFELWNSLSNTSIKSQYVEVFLNHRSIGLYRFSENYTEHLLDMNPSSRLFVGIDNSMYTKFRILPEDPPSSDEWEDWEQEYPDGDELLDWTAFYALAEIIAEADDATFINEIEHHIDLENVMDYYLFMNLCYGYDNAGKNWFFYKQFPESTFDIRLWDLDATWGRNHQGFEKEFDGLIANNIFDRLIELEPNDFKQNLKNRWLELRSDAFSHTTILNHFEANYNELEYYDIIDTENQVWDLNNDLTTEQLYISDWVSNRLAFLDAYYSSL